MSATLLLLLLVVIAYLAAHLAFDWIARHFLVVSGVEYLVLGILLGPQVSGVLSTDMLEAFAPITTLALGWIGAIVGMQFHLPELVRINGQLYRIAFFEALATMAVVFSAELAVLRWLFDIPVAQAAVPALALAAIAATSTPSGIEVVARRVGRRGPIVRQLEVATAIDALVAIVAIGLLMCIQNPASGSGRALTPTEWAAVTLGIGVIGGALFHLFLGGERHIDRIFIALAGAIILTSGAASYLGLSPLFPAMIVGVMLVNTSSSRAELARTLANAERPFYFVLLIVAGASWQAEVTGSFLIPVVLFLLARAVGKIGGARLGARLNDGLPTLGPDWGRALLGHGGLALALAVDYLQHGRLPYPSIVFTAVIVSVLLTDVSSARLVQSVVGKVMGPRDAVT